MKEHRNYFRSMKSIHLVLSHEVLSMFDYFITFTSIAIVIVFAIFLRSLNFNIKTFCGASHHYNTKVEASSSSNTKVITINVLESEDSSNQTDLDSKAHVFVA